jgi:hypothetical protein
MFENIKSKFIRPEIPKYVEDIKELKEDRDFKLANFNNADEDHHDIAVYELLAAEEKLRVYLSTYRKENPVKTEEPKKFDPLKELYLEELKNEK